MTWEGRFWQLLLVLATVTPAILAGYTSYDLYNRSPEAEKKLQATYISFGNPFTSLADLGSKAELSMRVDGRPVNNISVVNAYIQNTGASPIVPSDYYEDLTISAPAPWKIVTVEDSSKIKLHWKRLSDVTFQAAPVLLNPGDLVAATVYLTNSKYSWSDEVPKESEPKITWAARIANLHSIDESKPDLLGNYRSAAEAVSFGLHVTLGGWSLIYTLVATFVFQALYLHYLYQIGLLQPGRWKAVLLIVAVSILNLSAAEASSTYLFGDPLTWALGINHLLNTPPIIANYAILLWLAFRARRGQTTKAP